MKPIETIITDSSFNKESQQQLKQFLQQNITQINQPALFSGLFSKEKLAAYRYLEVIQHTISADQLPDLIQFMEQATIGINILGNSILENKNYLTAFTHYLTIITSPHNYQTEVVIEALKNLEKHKNNPLVVNQNNQLLLNSENTTIFNFSLSLTKFHYDSSTIDILHSIWLESSFSIRIRILKIIKKIAPEQIHQFLDQEGDSTLRSIGYESDN